MFGPDSAAWALDREAMLLLGAGPRALLLQLATRRVAAGVDEHSDFRADPWRRLDGTLRSYLRIIYGSTTAARDEIRRLNTLHRGIRGPGYDARDPVLSLWVHATLVDSTIVVERRLARSRCRAIRRHGSTTRRCRSPGRSACRTALLPPDLDAFEAYLADRLGPGGPVQVGSTARELAEAILHPPLPGVLARLPLDPRAYDWTLWPAIGLLPAASAKATACGGDRWSGASSPLARGRLARAGTRSCRRRSGRCRRRSQPIAGSTAGLSRTPGTAAEQRRRGPTGVASSSVWSSVSCVRDPVTVIGDVLLERRPERRRAHRSARLVEQVAALDVDDLVVARAGVAVDRPVEPPGRAAARPASRPGHSRAMKSAAASSANGWRAWSLPTRP